VSSDLTAGAGSPAGEPAPAHSDSGLLCLIRHGETEWSRAGKHTSRTDLPLTAFGEEQARALAPLVADLRPVLALSSPMQRARRTAELAGLSTVDTDPDLAEWYYGSYEGTTTPQIRLDHPRWTIWTGDPPGGETAVEVGARVDRLLARVAPVLATGNVIVFTHGHTGRVLAARWLELAPTDGRLFALDPASPCLFGTEHDRPVVRRWNQPNPAGHR
jgi:probable phosphoglycerate mutase